MPSNKFRGHSAILEGSIIMSNIETNEDFSSILEVEGIYAKGYGMISKLLMQDLRITPEAKCIYAYFCSYAGNGSQAFPSVSLILHHLGMSESRYYRHFNLLKEYGYIKTRQPKVSGKYSKLIYTIVLNPVPVSNEYTENEAKHDESFQNETLGNEYLQNEGTENEGHNNNSINKNNYNKKRFKNNSNKKRPSSKNLSGGKKDDVNNNHPDNKKIFNNSSQEMLLAIDLRDKIKKNNPIAKTPDDLQGWAREFDKMIRLDKRPLPDIKNVIRFSQSNNFWKCNILSASKLREKFDTLYLQGKNSKDFEEKDFSFFNKEKFLAK